MKDKNGIEKNCSNCRYYEVCASNEVCEKYTITVKAYEARIAELQEVIKLDLKSVNIDDINDTLIEVYEDKIKELEESFSKTAALLGEIGQDRDRLREEVKELGEKLTETVKLLGERTRECGELEAHNEVLQRRVQEFSMELLDQTMKENKDVLERLKNWEESEEKGKDK